MLRPVAQGVVAAAGVALSAFTTVSCGTTSQADQAQSVVKDFLSAAAKGDGNKACALLTADAQHLLESATSASCRQVISELGAHTPARQRSEVAQVKPSVSVHGNTATATYRSVTGGRQRRTLTLQKVGSEWKISQLPSSG